MTEQNYESLNAELESVRSELEQLKQDNEERIKCEYITNAAMKEALYQNHPSDEINVFLMSIGRSLDVDRIYIFEDNFEKDETSNTYEWCAEGVTPEINNLQDIPRSAVTWWYDHFEQGLDIRIPDLEAIRETEPETYSYLKPQGINSLVAKRLMHGDRIIGFFGVDNPRIDLMADISEFLDTMSNFLSALIQNRNIYLSSEAKYVAELEEKNHALNEALHKAEDANMAKSQFLSSMSHDIRTPLNAIIGMTAIAKEHIQEAERVQDCLQKITLSSKHLLGLINDVLDMAKIESGKMTLEMAELSLREAMDAVSTITRIQAKEKKQEYNVQIHDLLSDYIYCDSLRLNQVLLNILSNAIKFTPENGKVDVNVWQEPSSKGDDYVVTHIVVDDTGIGMSPEFMKTIFEAFTREDAKRIKKTQGTGLGMAITKRILDALGGEINVQSELDHGSSFHVILDLKRGDVSDKVDPVLIPEEMDLCGLRILLAEDNDINAEIAITILEENGASVTRCENGKLAVDCFEEAEQGTYNAVLMDLRMPVMDGLEATRTIRALQRPDAKTIPIIAMTADAFSEDAQKCIDAGMNAHVAKPIDIDILKRTLIRFIRV